MNGAPSELTSLEIYRHANSFFRALNIMHTKCSRQEISTLVAPLCVWSAFASELLFKCLHHIERASLPDKMHLGLTPETQNRLEQMWDDVAAERKDFLDKIDAAHSRPLPRDLRSNLSAGANGFRLIRYIYEGGSDIEFLLSDLPLILKRRILELKPEWASLG